MVARRDWVTWRTDLNRHLQAQDAPLALGALFPSDDALLEFRMELCDIVAELRHARDHADTVATPELIERLAPYLRPARRPLDPSNDDLSGAALGLGVSGQPSGQPDAMISQVRGYDASWETQARFFQLGNSVAYNAHLRRYTFPDQSYVEIQAHVPVLTHSYLSDALLFGASAALAITLPLTSAASGALAGAAFVSGATVRPSDVAWQGYTANYYAPPTLGVDAPNPVWGRRAFYGQVWTGSPLHTISFDGQFAQQEFPNFADQGQRFSWGNWIVGGASPRTPEFDADLGRDAVCAQPTLGLSAAQQAQCLVSHLAALTPVGAAAFDAVSGFASTPGSRLEFSTSLNRADDHTN